MYDPDYATIKKLARSMEFSKKPLYRYSDLTKYAFDNLLNDRIFLNQPKNFNDPLEFLLQPPDPEDLPPEITQYYVPELIPKKPGIIDESLLENMANKFKRESPQLLSKNVSDMIHQQKIYFINTFCCCCFTQNNDNLLMWGHYTNGHQGFCIEFSHHHEPFTKAQKVHYSETPPKFMVNTLIPGFKHTADIALQLNIESTLTKSSLWEYEAEYRLIDNMEHYYPHKRLDTEKIDPFKRYKPDAILSISFGCRMDEIFKYILFKILFTKNRKIKFFNTRIASKEYKLIFEPYSIPLEPDFDIMYLDEILTNFSYSQDSSEVCNSTPLYEELNKYKDIIG